VQTAAFAVASVLSDIAVVTLGRKTGIERREATARAAAVS